MQKTLTYIVPVPISHKVRFKRVLLSAGERECPIMQIAINGLRADEVVAAYPRRYARRFYMLNGGELTINDVF